MGRGTKGIELYITNGNGDRGNRVGTIGIHGNISRKAWNRAVENQRRGDLLENMMIIAKGQTGMSGPAILIADGSQGQRRNKVVPAYQMSNTPASQKQRENAEKALNSEVEYLINNAAQEKGMLIDPVGFRKDMNNFVKAVKNGNSKTANKIASSYMGSLALDNNNEQREEIMTLLERMSNFRKVYKKTKK